MARLTLKTKFPGLKIYCNGCKKEMEEMCQLHSIERQCYKIRIYIPGTDNKKTKSLEARTEEKAILEAIEFKNSFNTASPVKERVIKSIPTHTISNKTTLTLNDCVTSYLNFLRNIDVPFHKQRQRDRDHLQNIETIIAFLSKVVDADTLIEDFSETHVGEVFYAVANKRKKNGDKITAVTFNNYISAYRSFFEFLINEKSLPIKNHFKSIGLRKTRKKVHMLTLQEFYAVIEKIESGSPYRNVTYTRSKGGTFTERKNNYRPWLKHGIMLALYGGGRRREEIAMLKWRDIQVNEYTRALAGGIVHYRNLKVERQKNILFEDEQLPIEVPITGQLAELLIELGWHENKGKEKFVIAPQVANREMIMEDMTKGFSHYYRQLDNPRPGISFKSIRKTYITYTKAILAGNAKLITGHSSDDVIEKHYEDTQLIREKMVKELKF